MLTPMPTRRRAMPLAVTMALCGAVACKAPPPLSGVSDNGGIEVGETLRVFMDKTFKLRVIRERDAAGAAGASGEDRTRVAFAFAQRVEIVSVKLSQELPGSRLTGGSDVAFDVVPNTYRGEAADVSPYPFDISFRVKDESGTATPASCSASKVWLNAPFQARCDRDFSIADSPASPKSQGRNARTCDDLGLTPASGDATRCQCGTITVAFTRLAAWTSYQVAAECLGKAQNWSNSVCLQSRYKLEAHPASGDYCRCGLTYKDKAALEKMDDDDVSACRDANRKNDAPSCNRLGLPIVPGDPNQCACGATSQSLRDLSKDRDAATACARKN